VNALALPVLHTCSHTHTHTHTHTHRHTHTHQLFGPHVVEDPLGVLTVVAALHDGQEQLGGVVLR
jgi:ABC-type Zn2+ transport system substrate-binding protein/surface adhesin